MIDLFRLQKKIIKLTGVALLAVLALASGYTAASIVHDMSLTNQVTVPKVDVEITEEVGGKPEGGQKKKEVSFQNTGTADIFLRVAYAETWTGKDGIILSNTAPDGGPLATKNWTPEWETDWTNGRDGWYYYNHAIRAGAGTEKILTTVSFPSEYQDAVYEDAVYSLYFKTEAVQASDEWAVNRDAVDSIFKKTLGQQPDGWQTDKYNATVFWP